MHNNVTEVAQYHILVGAPPAPYVNGMWRSNSPSVYSFRVEDNDPHATGLIWNMFPSIKGTTPTFQFSSAYNLGTYDFTSGHYGMTYWVTAQAINACGVSGHSAPRYSILIEPGVINPAVIWGVPYPNPASDLLYVDIDSDLEEVPSVQQSKSSVEQERRVFNVRLYDGQGNMVRQTSIKSGTVQFNVSNLPNGVYYLHVYGDANSAPEIRQVMIER